MKKMLNTVIWIACILVVVQGVLLSVLLFSEVIMRYIFNSSIIIVEELSRILLIWTGFLGAAIALHEHAHVGIDLIKERLKGKSKRIVQASITLLMMVFCSVILIASFRVVPRQLQQMLPTLRISMFWPYLAIPVSMSICLLRLSYTLACNLLNKPEDLKSVKDMFDKRRESA
mgnify:CR=1 FL=1